MLKELQNKHQEVARLSFQGFSPTEISEKTGVRKQSVYAILRDPLAKSFLAGLNDKANHMVLDTRKRLVGFEKLALDRAEEILAPGSLSPDAVKVALFKDILDRNGYKATDKTEHIHKFGETSDDELDARIKAMEEALTEFTLTEKETDQTDPHDDLNLNPTLNEENF